MKGNFKYDELVGGIKNMSRVDPFLTKTVRHLETLKFCYSKENKRKEVFELQCKVLTLKNLVKDVLDDLNDWDC